MQTSLRSRARCQCFAGGGELGGSSHAALFEIAIAVEIRLDTVGERACGRSRRRVDGKRVEAQLVELGRELDVRKPDARSLLCGHGRAH